jgi:hypothetical protein
MLARTTFAQTATDGPRLLMQRGIVPLTLLMGLMLVTLAVVGMLLVLPARASAALPDCFSVDFQQTCVNSEDADFTDTGLCGFPVEVHVVGYARFRFVFANDGTDTLVSRTIQHHERATIVNPVTGRFFTDRSDWTGHETFLPDDSFEARSTGLFHDARMDDGQLLFHQSGNHSALVSPEDETIPGTDVFRGNFQSEAAFPGTVCPLLAQSA